MVTILTEPIQVYRGDTNRVPVLITGDDNNPIDYSQYENWECQWRASENSGVAVSATIEFTDTTVDIIFPATGIWCDGVIDLQTTTNGVIKTWFKADVVYVEDVTR